MLLCFPHLLYTSWHMFVMIKTFMMEKCDDGASVLAGRVCFYSGGQSVQGSAWPSNAYFSHSRPRIFTAFHFLQPIQFLSNDYSKSLALISNVFEHFNSWHVPVLIRFLCQLIQNLHNIHKLWNVKLCKKHIF